MFKKIYTFFASLKLTIFLFLFLAATSILGTLIPQGLNPEQYQELYNPRLFSIFDFFNAFDMYHSWWFTLLLVLLSVNVVFCTFPRIPRIWRLTFRGKKIIDDSIFASSPIRKTIALQKNTPGIEQQSADIIKALVATPVKEEKDGRIYLFAEKGRYSRLGIILVHLSIIFILAGGLIGTIWGFNGQMLIVEGEQSDIVTLFSDAGTKKLDFSVRCSDFAIDFYETGMPKEYRSDVTIIEGEKERISGSIRVNHPLKYGGMKFCQATYGIAGVKNLQIFAKNTTTKDEIILHLNMMKKVSLPESDTFFAIAKFSPDYEGRGPAVLGVVIESDRPHDIFWIFGDNGKTDNQKAGNFTFTLKDFEKIYYTGIQVSRDPGVLLVWFGFVTILAGFILSIFLTHRKMWIRISENQNGGEIKIAATTSGDRKDFEKNLERLLAASVAE
ncbi:MAG: cytochrome c biogenesis protein ResB [Deltaproteobacteria bacterium]|nr:cytochrome c biogenesis protein ResB [Deltaproteobacteria bacterium]MBN2846082.1 cytochrome c biogenesis protein ResB [Deltaproteobacteria bacterium]